MDDEWAGEQDRLHDGWSELTLQVRSELLRFEIRSQAVHRARVLRVSLRVRLGGLDDYPFLSDRQQFGHLPRRRLDTDHPGGSAGPEDDSAGHHADGSDYDSPGCDPSGDWETDRLRDEYDRMGRGLHIP
jgi:hypothetical protein